MIWGSPGIGKSSIVAQVTQQHKINFVDVRLFQLAPTDLRGLPVAEDGISFVPFFEKVNGDRDWYTTGVCVYLTDGYGTFPQEPPALPVLWIVTPAGLALELFPFGEAVRLLSVSI